MLSICTVLGATIAVTFHWSLVAFVTRFFEQASRDWNVKWSYWSCAVVCAFGTIFVLIFLPETKGKTNNQIRVYFGHILEKGTSEGAHELAIN